MKIVIPKNVPRRMLIGLVGLTVAGLIIASTIFILLDEQNDLSEEDQITDLNETQFNEASSFNSPSIVQYNTAENCWVIYQSNVYDVSSILSELKDVNESECGTELEKLSNDSITKIAPYIVSSVIN
ncbi:hypothetical protein JW978_01280 [Candidatus Dojkabacteria bacterium]|nr:hypothetical protein [Candidatus Dojkabacteria bacterium]